LSTTYNTCVLIVALLSILLRLIIFQYSTISNDDLTYTSISQHISTNMISLDGLSPHTVFPPGYPSLLFVLRQLLGSNDAVFFVNAVFFPLIVSFIALKFVRELFPSINQNLAAVSLFLLPAFSTSSFTIATSSEYSTAALIWIGIYLFFVFRETDNSIILLLSNAFFCLAYLFRPENIALLGVSGLLNLTHRKPKVFLKRYIIWYVVPFLLIAFPYVVFLKNSTGLWTISGKAKFISDHIAAMYNDNTFDRVTASLKAFIRLYAAFNLINPLIYVGIAAFIFRALRGTTAGNCEYRRLFELAAFAIPVNLAILYYLPMVGAGRTLIPYIPIYVIFALYGANGIKWSFVKTAVVGIVCVSSVVAVLFLPASNNHPYLYRQTVQRAMVTEHRPFEVIAARDPKIAYYAQNSRIVPISIDMLTQSDMVIASNLTHPSLEPGPEELEKQILAGKEVPLGDAFHLCAETRAGPYSVIAFCRNDRSGSGL